MKYLLFIAVLLSLSFCDQQPKSKIGETFNSAKKTLVECLSKSEGASADLKQWAKDVLVQNDFKDILKILKLKDNPQDIEAIRVCRKEIFSLIKNQLSLSKNLRGGLSEKNK